MIVLSLPHDGHGFEREVFGHTVSDVPPKYRQVPVENLREGITKVKGYQHDLNWDPRYPRTPLARALFHVVSHRLEKRHKKLLMFDAVGTVLDIRWGIDCWFECGERIATVDLTVSPYKKHYKAHFLLTRNHFLWNHYFGVGRAIARKIL